MNKTMRMSLCLKVTSEDLSNRLLRDNLHTIYGGGRQSWSLSKTSMQH